MNEAVIFSKDKFLEDYCFLYNIRCDFDIPEYIRDLVIDELPDPDLPHQEHHIETVRNFVRAILPTLELEQYDYWSKVVDMAITYHDIAQGLTVDGQIPLDGHAIIGSVITFMQTRNKDASDLVHFHIFDNIGDDGSDKSKVLIALRDADQLANMGYSGLIRFLYYLGWRDEEITLENNPSLISDSRMEDTGLPKDYESIVRDFSIHRILPWIIDHDKFKEVFQHLRINFDRFYGRKDEKLNFLRMLKSSPEILEYALQGKMPYKDYAFHQVGLHPGEIQAISIKYQHLFLRKILLDLEIFDTLTRIYSYIQRKSGEERQAAIDTILYEVSISSPWNYTPLQTLLES